MAAHLLLPTNTGRRQARQDRSGSPALLPLSVHDPNPDDAEFIWPGLPAVHGRQAVVAFLRRTAGSFPGRQGDHIKSIVEQGDTVAVEYRSKGSRQPLTAGDGKRATLLEPVPNSDQPATRLPKRVPLPYPINVGIAQLAKQLFCKQTGCV
jgi:hypothetical protein